MFTTGYPLFRYEEAGDPLDYRLQAALAEFYPAPMATGGKPVQPPRRLQPYPAWRHGGMRPDRDYLQFDCALSYGLVEYLGMLDMLGCSICSKPMAGYLAAAFPMAGTRCHSTSRPAWAWVAMKVSGPFPTLW